MHSLRSVLKRNRSSDSTIKAHTDAAPSSGRSSDTQTSPEHQQPRTIYKPVHAARDAAMSIPVDERKATLEMLARFRDLDGRRVNYEGSPLASAVRQREEVEPQYFGKGKGKARAESFDSRDFALNPSEYSSRGKFDSVIRPETSKRKRGSSSRCSELELSEDDEQTETAAASAYQGHKIAGPSSAKGEPPTKRPESLATIKSQHSSQSQELATNKPQSFGTAASYHSSRNSTLELSELWDSASSMATSELSGTPLTSAAPSLMIAGDSSSAVKKGGERFE